MPKTTNWNALFRKLLVPVLCLAVGGAAGFALRGKLLRDAIRPAFSEVREDGYRFINPLLECDSEQDRLQNRALHPFEAKVEAYLRSREGRDGIEKVSLYFRELNDGPWFGLAEQERYTPASMRKIPMMIAILKQSERTPGLLTRTVPALLAQDHNERQNVKPSQVLEPGRAYTVAELVSRMIVQSDNNAFMLLSRVVDERELDRAYSLLSMPLAILTREDVPFSVHTYASFFRILYNATYLRKDLSDQALELLTRVEFRSGIVAGVPAGTVVAHKFGEHSDPATGRAQLHDCGIVFFPHHPYLLCVMTLGSRFELLDDTIAGVSRLVYAEVDAQHRSEH